MTGEDNVFDLGLDEEFEEEEFDEEGEFEEEEEFVEDDLDELEFDEENELNLEEEKGSTAEIEMDWEESSDDNNYTDFADDELAEEMTESFEEAPDAIKEEYDALFSGEEQLEQQLASIMNAVSVSIKSIPAESVILPKFKKELRSKTIVGLTGLVSTMPGVVSPIHVMTMEDSDDEYLLLDGSRRLYAAIRAGRETVNAIIWDFEDKETGSKLANILGLILNRSQKFSNKELWSSLRVLDTVNNCTPGKIEFLLQLNSGDAMKLKDIMLAEGDSEVDDLREKFLNDELTIEGAYKKLTTLRKKENRLDRDEEREMDLQKAAEDFSEGSKMSPDMKPRLSTDEVLEVLEMGTEDVSDQTLEELKNKGDAMRNKADSPHVQEVGNRHPVDPEIRRKTFERDDFHCRCCGIGGELYLSILVFHHAVPVFAGGPDTVDNGLTLCANCHLTLHNYVDGLLHGDLATYSDEEQQILRNIFKYGNIAIRASQKMGLKREQVRELDASSRKHIMPNTNVKANDDSFFESKTKIVDKD